MVVRRIGFIGYDGVTAIDLFGPIEVFDTASRRVRQSARAYELILLGVSGKRFTLEQGISVEAHAALTDAPSLDTIIVPGGSGALDPAIVQPLSEWLRSNARAVRRVASVCLGMNILAEAGLLDGRRATTHWGFVEEASRKFPQIRLQPDAIYVNDGAFYTSAGMTAGIDLSLALVADDFGETVALKVARTLVVYLRRSGGQMQYSEPLQFQTRAADAFGDLANWVLQNLQKPLSLSSMAKHVGLSTRQFSRRFKEAFGVSPATYVERLRLDEARRRLQLRSATVGRIASSVGYASADAFRRAFERKFGLSPLSYRRRFSSHLIDARPSQRISDRRSRLARGAEVSD